MGPVRTATTTLVANLSVTKPDGCFRISANGVNYLADYLARHRDWPMYGDFGKVDLYSRGCQPESDAL